MHHCVVVHECTSSSRWLLVRAADVCDVLSDEIHLNDRDCVPCDSVTCCWDRPVYTLVRGSDLSTDGFLLFTPSGPYPLTL